MPRGLFDACSMIAGRVLIAVSKACPVPAVGVIGVMGDLLAEITPDPH